MLEPMPSQAPACDLRVDIAGISFPTPFLNASGCFHPAVFNAVSPLAGAMGGIVVKTVTRTPRAGNVGHRAVELPGIGMLNSIGLQNPGIEAFLETEALEYASYGLPVILSMAAASVEEFADMAALTQKHPHGAAITAMELNLSCPNVAQGGVDFGVSPAIIRQAVSNARDHCDKPIFAKLTPNVASVLPLAQAAAEAGAHGLTAINTALGCAIDVKRRAPVLSRATGGYSGPGLKPIALRVVWEIHREMPEMPIIGVGGVACLEDALEFLMAGASLTQVGTACFRDPQLFATLARDLSRYLQAEGISTPAALTGCAHGEKIR